MAAVMSHRPVSTVSVLAASRLTVTSSTRTGSVAVTVCSTHSLDPAAWGYSTRTVARLAAVDLDAACAT
jgi:hypothetical protein